jgi:DNA-binding NtrC family response regulator
MTRSLLSVTHSESSSIPAALLGKHLGCNIEAVDSPWEAFQVLRTRTFSALLVEFPVADWSPAEFVADLKAISGQTPIVCLHPKGQYSEAAHFKALGAFECLCGEAQLPQLAQVVRAAIAETCDCQGPSDGEEPWRKALVGNSQPMLELCELIRVAGPRRSTVLISGETGTGKELVARALHAASPRANLEMVPVNCAALPENLLEAELFGHTKGAFTGALNARIGRFEGAHGSTLFLDEIGEMPLDLQAKVLRAIQEREIQRIGSSEIVKTNCRLIAASNVDLGAAVAENRFRGDLYYRLGVVPIRVPTLRERKEDIPVLIEHFVEKICKFEDLPLKEVSRQAVQKLLDHDWPGNVRQLEHALEAAVALSGARQRLLPCDFQFPEAAPVRFENEPEFEMPGSGIRFEETIQRIERMLLDQAIRKVGGNKARAAEMLGMKRTTLISKMKVLSECAC